MLDEQHFASSEMGESMDTDLLPELSGETWVASTLLDGLTTDLLPAGTDLDLIVASRQDRMLAPFGASQLVVPHHEHRDMNHRFALRRTCRCFTDSFPPAESCVLAGFASGCANVPGILYYVSGTKISVSATGTNMGHVAVGRRWNRVAMDLLDLSITSAKGNRYVLVMVDCFSRLTDACPLPDKTALSVADAFIQYVVCLRNA